MRMGDRVWQVPQEQFIEAWNQSASLDEAAAKLKKLAGGNMPRWAAMARAASLRKDGITLQQFPSNVVAAS